MNALRPTIENALNSNYWATKPIHRILVYTEHGLTSEVVESFFQEVPCERIFDPFVGSGTVGVEALLRGRTFIGSDSNPAAVITSLAKLNPETPVTLRPLPQLSKYYNDVIYESLLELSRHITTALEAGVFFNTARRFSKFRYSPAPRFGKKGALGDPVAYFNTLLDLAKHDIHMLGDMRGDVILADSTVWMPRRVCGALTSPPFANNVDYVRHTQIELLWLGIEPSRARDMQLPACEAATRAWKESLPINIQPGGKRAKGYQRFLAQYLYYTRRHIELLAERLEDEAWYTIGDSVLGGVYVPVHEYLAKFGEEFGLKATLINLGPRRAKKERYLFLLKFKAKK